jgi:hypothetical protein
MVVASEVKEIAPAGIYANPKARRILEYLLEYTQTVFTATVLPTDEIKYEQVENILGEGSEGYVELLDAMATAGVLQSQLADKVPACPVCDSKQVSTRYLCPQCSSYDILRTYLFEHLKCGKVGNEGSFRRGDQIVCPKCQAVLHEFGVEYRAIGVWYECNKCKYSFNNPNHSHFCRPKHHEFPTDLVALMPIHQYELNRSAIESIRKEVLVYAEAITYLENLGLTVQAPHALTGHSGQNHTFDMVLPIPKKGWRGEGRTVAIDVIVDGYSAEAEVFREFIAKARDLKSAETYLVVVPGLLEDAKTTLSDAGVTWFEAVSLREAMQALLNGTMLKEQVE